MRSRGREKTVPLGIREQSVRLGDHVAYLWETPEQFAEAVGFLEIGLRGEDHCVVFGYSRACGSVCGLLGDRGFDVDALQEQGRLTVVGGAATGAAMLANLGEVFQRALDGGAPMIRLLGNIGWREPDWPAEREILEFEARVTGAARAFPSVIVCMYDVRSLPGPILLHGAFETHPLTFCGNLLRENPYHLELEPFLAELGRRGPG